MSLITKKIETQAFEIVRDLIGYILKDELESQKIIHGFADEINLYVGRSTSFNQSEKLMINVSLDSANYTNRNQRSTSGTTQYYIDIFTTAKESENELGGTASSRNRDKFVGLCRSILSDTHYKTLSLPAGTIASAGIEGFENFNAADQKRLVFCNCWKINLHRKVN